MHGLALTSNGEVWEWHTWQDFKRIIHDDDPNTALSPFSSLTRDTELPKTSSSNTKSGVKQISAGWHFSSILRHDHRVFIWSERTPHLSPPETIIYEDSYQGLEVDMPYTESIINYHMFELSYSFIHSDPFSMIAAGDNFLIALTVSGQIYKHDIPSSAFTDPSEPLSSTYHWQHLPEYCNLDHLLRQPEYIMHNIMPPAMSTSVSNNQYTNPEQSPKNTPVISHITAHFKSFIAYSSPSLGVVLMGSNETTSTTAPTIVPSLQNRGIVKCTQGDWHHGAITDSGHLLVWGANNGGLGLGNLGFANPTRLSRRENVDEPVKVRFTQENTSLFNWGKSGNDTSGYKDKYVIDASFGGWHSSAVVMDTGFLLKREEEEKEDEEHEDNDTVAVGMAKTAGRKVMKAIGTAMDYMAS